MVCENKPTNEFSSQTARRATLSVLRFKWRIQTDESFGERAADL
jgi:hypothetical protein